MKTQKILAVSSLFLALPFFVAATPGEKNEEMRNNLQKRLEMKKEQLEQKIHDFKGEAKIKGEKKEEKKSERMAFVCENITEKLGQRNTEFAEQKKALQTKKTERVESVEGSRTERDKKLSEERAEAKERRDRMYQNLLNNAETDEQKVAIAKFQAGVEAAVAKRQASVDQALKSFRASADALRIQKKDTRAEALATFQSKVSAALAEAKQSCSDGVSNEEVRETYKKAIEDAKAELKAARPTGEAETKVSDLAHAKNQAIREAMIQYRTTLDALLKELKEAIGTTSESTEN